MKRRAKKANSLGLTAAAGNFREQVHLIVEGKRFASTMVFMVLMNSLVILVELVRNEERLVERPTIYLALDILFVIFFTAEAGLKLIAYRLNYFFSSWDLFDFFLVVAGYMGIVTELMQVSSGDAMQLIRFNIVMRLLRLLRVVRLMRYSAILYALVKQKNISFCFADHIEKITILKLFARAHREAQHELLKYCGLEASEGFEEALILMESETSVIEAIDLACQEMTSQGKDLIVMQWMAVLQETAMAAGGLMEFLEEAYHTGIVSQVELETMIQPLLNHEAQVQQIVVESHFGIMMNENDTEDMVGEIAAGESPTNVTSTFDGTSDEILETKV